MQIFTFLVTLGGICLFFVCGASAFETDSVSVFVMEGDAVTLYTDDKMKQDRMTWYFEDNRIALINGDQSKICADDQCKERFRDRLNVNQTGSLTIMNIRTTDSGDYKLKITSRNIEKIFSVTVQGVSDAERDEMKRKSVKEGESVTLDPGVTNNPNDLMTWHFNDSLIAEITGDQSKICTDVQCKERFRDRLKLDLQTGSLNITDTRTTDSGDYKLQINSSRFSIIRIFTVIVTYSGSSSVAAAAAAATAAAVLLLLVAAGFYKRNAIMKCIRRQPRDQMNDAEDPPLEQIDPLMQMATIETSPNETEAANETEQ
ncbi:uncharacterized protein LOC131530498 [Onychostoma macrolepis]|uniref:Immunoglobulin domain-containing protein n=1 Tax=Onychostoma macrolepis TaxID=369639 RepID=A0A7J6BQC1_9TELE|nr:uncharacterized protein LOC131530498 [Onychostoma macrolepis]KAF4097209.1 hypothetical protein G5714_021217 [Onychostoma macrolepis]